jgi:hypothetical protein
MSPWAGTRGANVSALAPGAAVGPGGGWSRRGDGRTPGVRGYQAPGSGCTPCPAVARLSGCVARCAQTAGELSVQDAAAVGQDLPSTRNPLKTQGMHHQLPITALWSTCTTLGDYPLGFRAAAVQPSPRHPLLWWGMNSTLLGEYRLDQHPQPHGVPSRVRNACESTYVNPTGYVSPTRSASFRTEVNDVLTWFVRLSVHVSAMRNSMGFAHPLRLCANSQFPTSGLCCDAGYATLRSIKDPLVRYRRGPFLGRHQHAALHTTPTDRLASLDRWQSSSTGTQERSGSWQSCLV